MRPPDTYSAEPLWQILERHFFFNSKSSRIRFANSEPSPPKKNLILSAVRLRRASFLRGQCAAGGGGGAGSSYFKYSAPAIQICFKQTIYLHHAIRHPNRASVRPVTYSIHDGSFHIT